MKTQQPYVSPFAPLFALLMVGLGLLFLLRTEKVVVFYEEVNPLMSQGRSDEGVHLTYIFFFRAMGMVILVFAAMFVHSIIKWS